MSAMYKAIQVTKPGEFATVMKPLVDPGPGQVRIRVEASGVCHSDAGTVEGSFAIDWPRVPGHEVVGRIDALGSGVQGWAVGSARRMLMVSIDISEVRFKRTQVPTRDGCYSVRVQASERSVIGFGQQILG